MDISPSRFFITFSLATVVNIIAVAKPMFSSKEITLKDAIFTGLVLINSYPISFCLYLK